MSRADGRKEERGRVGEWERVRESNKPQNVKTGMDLLTHAPSLSPSPSHSLTHTHERERNCNHLPSVYYQSNRKSVCVLWRGERV